MARLLMTGGTLIRMVISAHARMNVSELKMSTEWN